MKTFKTRSYIDTCFIDISIKHLICLNFMFKQLFVIIFYIKHFLLTIFQFPFQLYFLFFWYVIATYSCSLNIPVSFNKILFEFLQISTPVSLIKINIQNILCLFMGPFYCIALLIRIRKWIWNDIIIANFPLPNFGDIFKYSLFLTSNIQTHQIFIFKNQI